MRFCAVLFFIGMLLPAIAQGFDPAKRLPPAGIAVPAETKRMLWEKLRELQEEVAAVEGRSLANIQILNLPDALIYEKAVRWALEHNEFYRTNEFAVAEELIAEGLRRIREIQAGYRASWLEKTGLVVLGYRSRIDGSVQPYSLVIPENYKQGDGLKFRVDVWLHGRDEKLTELKFIHERSTKTGEFAPAEAIVVHPYGRYCNAFKFAGEVDVMEALENLELRGIGSSRRVALRGFSMGGAGVWHLAAHYADRWVVAAPGAGFAETAGYLRLKPESVAPWERTLWQWYDATDYAANLFNCPVVAYSGELDKQKQAADVMAEALDREGLPLVHLIGPKTEHKYEPETKNLLNSIVDTMALREKERFPREVRLTTRTLRYPKMHWLVLTGLEKHWERADAHGLFNGSSVQLWLTNVTSFALDFQGMNPMLLRVEINGRSMGRGEVTNQMFFERKGNTWERGNWPLVGRKTPGLQGPIDDAFMDSFVFVPPADGFEKGFHEETSRWLKGEYERAVFEWRAQFRGDVIVVSEREAEEQARRSHLVLWGDPQSNGVIAKLLPHLPVKWTSEQLKLGNTMLESARHVPVMIFPNPWNPEKYVVLNSGFTFRGFGSNADQTPKLPDYAVVDVADKAPFKGGIKKAGFFNERWELKER